MNNDINNIFSNQKQDELEKVVKKNRKKLNFKLVSITIITTLVIIILGNLCLNLLSAKYVYNEFNKDLDQKVIEYQIKYPNEYISHQSYIETGYFKFQSTYNISHKIGGKLLYSNTLSILGGLNKNNSTGNSFFITEPFPAISNDISARPSTPYGLKDLIFMYPYVNYENNINDFSLLNELDDSKTLEMCLSFDGEYDYEEINHLIDSNLITFYWVNDSNEENKVYEIENNTYKSQDSVLGIKSVLYNGSDISDVDERLSKFKDSINYLKENHNPYIDADNIDLKNIKISGIVVVGNPSDIKKLENNKIIKHAILGNVTDKF